MRLTRTAARTMLLAAQGLLRRDEQPVTKDGMLATIRRMGALQIDTIHVVARSPYFVLWSRLGGYDPVWLDELLAEGSLFEYWSHAACFLPIADYPLYRRLMLDRLKGWRSSHAWVETHADDVERLLEQIRARGTVRSADFARTDGRSGSWWDWKPEKEALEHLHSSGRLMISHRHNFQRHYALREQVLPEWQDVDAPPLDEVLRTLVLKAVYALGVTTAAWVPDYFRTPSTGTAVLLESLADGGALLRAEIEGFKATAYIHPDNGAVAGAAAAGDLRAEQTTLLSPFDPIVWHRARARDLFDFDYTIECYTPEAKRRYGYFTLPILHGDALVGRLDAKAHRQAGLFEIKSLHLEPGVAATEPLVRDLAAALRDCAAWHKTPAVNVVRSNPPEVAALLNAALHGDV